LANQRAQTSGNSGRHAVISILLPCLLIGHFLWNLLTPAHAFPMRTEQVTTMVLDGLLFAGLFGLKEAMPKPLFWLALAAGLGLFALRLSSNEGWWTGHFVYYLRPR
jgi:hypothetical protein